MTTYDPSSRTSMADLHMTLDAALKAAFVGTNVRIAHSGLRYSTDGNVAVKLELRVDTVSADGAVEIAEAKHYKAICAFDGLKPEQLNQRFTVNGRAFTLIGALRRRSLKCYLITDATGKRLVCTAEMLRRAFADAAV